jgi:hypothetical protein
MTPRPVEPLRLAWLSADRSETERWLARLGLDPDADHTLRWAAGSVHLVESPDGRERLVLETGPAAAQRTPLDRPDDAAPDLLAVGWATVESDRAASEFPMAAFGAVPDDPHLGAFARRSIGDARLILLEPNTEGRLSATLARWGEGPVALYLAVRGADPRSRGDGGAGSVGTGVVSAVRDGPLGPSAILLGGPITGPHVILVLGRSSADDVADADEAHDGTDPPAAGTIGA